MHENSKCFQVDLCFILNILFIKTTYLSGNYVVTESEAEWPIIPYLYRLRSKWPLRLAFM